VIKADIVLDIICQLEKMNITKDQLQVCRSLIEHCFFFNYLFYHRRLVLDGKSMFNQVKNVHN
jgi:hypothetical protein